MFFAGLALLLLTFATLYFSGALFDAGNKRYISAFVFQPNNLSAYRIGHPLPLDRLSDKFVREKLIKKFVVEYFYVTPNLANIERRARANSVMAAMASPAVFKEWIKTEADVIEKLSGKKMMRTVAVADEIIQKGDYWEVYYKLKTWDVPNDMDAQPVVSDGVMYLKLSFDKGVRDKINGQDFDAQKYLGKGGDPAAIFKFTVEEVQR
jgi:hypothetical protein